MAWRRFQPNPLGKNVGDCTVRAISAATGLTWDEAYASIAAQGFEQKDMPSGNSVWGSWLQAHGYQYESAQAACPFCVTVRDFAEAHPQGIYIVGTGTHVVTIRDGDWYDSWDSGDAIPIYCFKED
jgi:hypothetical protein